MHAPRWVRAAPAALVALRVALGPALLALVWGAAGRGWVGAVLLAAFASDVFDGVLARRIGAATERLRVADSRADAFYLACVAAAVWAARPEVVHAYRWPLAAVLALQACSYVFDLVRFGRLTSLHAYTSKLWGCALFAAALGLLTFHANGAILWPAIVLGVVSNADATAIKLILPVWTNDVPSVWHARALRRRAGGAGIGR